MSCDQDSLGFKEKIDYPSVNDYAYQLVESTLAINQDLVIRNQQVFKLPSRFARELDILAKITNYIDLVHLIDTTSLALDLSQIKIKTTLLEEISEALTEKSFTRESLIAAVEVQLQDQIWWPSKKRPLRSSVGCMNPYTFEVQKTLIREIDCIAAASSSPKRIIPPFCEVPPHVLPIRALLTVNKCLKEAQR